MTIMSSSLAFTVTVLLLLTVFFSSAAGDGAEEVRSLLEFKKGIKTDPLGKIFSSWNQSSVYSSNNTKCPIYFYGVLCDPGSSQVVAIHLDGLNLSGDLKFFTLASLKFLVNLTLSGNFFTGRLVPALGSMNTLQHLDLSNNQFYGPIPARMKDLWNLNYLNLSRNNFTGGFPIGNSNLGQLKVLDLHANSLWGDVRDLFFDLRNVEYMDLSGNSFFGSLAMSVENVSSLANTVQYLNLSGNNLAGGFFGENVIGLFRNLKVLDLGHNGVTGELPSFGSLPNLQVLKLSNNKVYGSIPVELLLGLVPLTELDLSGNGFSGG